VKKDRDARYLWQILFPIARFLLHAREAFIRQLNMKMNEKKLMNFKKISVFQICDDSNMSNRLEGNNNNIIWYLHSMQKVRTVCIARPPTRIPHDNPRVTLQCDKFNEYAIALHSYGASKRMAE
jgi:hypothetical protein